ncbi:MAG: hypothetical protein ACK45Y_10625 [Betaproteobacteria bacterium]|jgi:hypothetical protein|nr:hypothetical protein AEM42_07490 [Betaproteobacteria bacterium UKL13-2]HCG53981.1 hypothetical protein [Betaproteobacteria bacterium]
MNINAQQGIQIDGQRHHLKKRDERLFQAIFLVSFPVFLVVVLTTRLLPVANESKKQTSILGEASNKARSTLAMALMD